MTREQIAGMPDEPERFTVGIYGPFVHERDYDALRAHCADLTRQLAAARADANKETKP